jgi:hypothetical protein
VNTKTGGEQFTMRTVSVCRECGEEREIAAAGLCFKCYRAQQRTKKRDDAWSKPDEYATSMKAQRKGRKSLVSIIAALEDLENGAMLPGETLAAIRKLLRPAVDRIGSILDATVELDEFHK